MLGAAGQEGSLFELVQHTRIRIQIQIPEPPIDRNELVQCQAKCRAKKKKDGKSNSQRIEKAKHEPRWFAASVAQVLHSENAKENCWLKGVKKKEWSGWGGKCENAENHVSFMLAAALNIISAAPATKIHFFCGETTEATPAKTLPTTFV